MSQNPIPFLDLPKMHEPLKAEILQAVSGLISEARFIGGQPVTAFENAFAEFCHTKGCVGVANGTDALMLALRVLGVSKGDVVVVPAHTFIATAEAASMLGAVPRFVDVDPVTYTMSPKALSAVNPKGVKAVMPVHIYGQPADIKPIMDIANKNGWYVVEDVAQAHGAKYLGQTVGSFGHMAGFSFYPGKNLGAFGDGGAVLSSDLDLIDKARRIADHGRETKQTHGVPGVNSRLDSIQAAILGIKLKKLNAWNTARAQVAKWYDDRLKDVKGLTAPALGPDRTHVYHLYVVLVPERDKLQQVLGAADVGTGIHYAVPLHLQPAYADLGYKKGDFPVAEKVTSQCLSLPMFPDLSESQVDRACKVIRDHLRAGA